MLELKKMGFILIIVTNQSGIARGYFTDKQFLCLTKWMIYYLQCNFVYIDAVYYCPHYIKGVIKNYQKFCFCRKPNPGMLIFAKQYFHINMNVSYIVGDTQDDMLAGAAAYVKTRVLVRSGNYITRKSINSATWVIDSLADLPKMIKSYNKNC